VDFGVDRTDYQEEELIDFAVEVGRTNCSLAKLVAVDFAVYSAQKYQRYSAVVGVGSDFDLVVGHYQQMPSYFASDVKKGNVVSKKKV
jgi:hypothetical protein